MCDETETSFRESEDEVITEWEDFDFSDDNNWWGRNDKGEEIAASNQVAQLRELVDCNDIQQVTRIWCDIVDGGVERLNSIAVLAEMIADGNDTTSVRLAAILSQCSDCTTWSSEKAQCVFGVLFHNRISPAVKNLYLAPGMQPVEQTVRTITERREAAVKQCKAFIGLAIQTLREKGDLKWIEGVEPYHYDGWNPRGKMRRDFANDLAFTYFFNESPDYTPNMRADEIPILHRALVVHLDPFIGKLRQSSRPHRSLFRRSIIQAMSKARQEINTMAAVGESRRPVSPDDVTDTNNSDTTNGNAGAANAPIEPAAQQTNPAVDEPNPTVHEPDPAVGDDAGRIRGGGKDKPVVAMKVWPDPLVAPKLGNKRCFGPGDYHFAAPQDPMEIAKGNVICCADVTALNVAMSLCLSALGYILNTIGLALDILLPSGIALRQSLGLDDCVSVSSIKNKLQTTIRPLMDREHRVELFRKLKRDGVAPVIVASVAQGWRDQFSQETNSALVYAYCNAGLTPETTGKGGNCLRAAFRYSQSVPPDEALKDERPVLRIGSRAVLIADICKKFEDCLMDLDVELMQMGHRFIDETQRKILKRPLKEKEGNWCKPILTHLKNFTEEQRKPMPLIFQYIFQLVDNESAAIGRVRGGGPNDASDDGTDLRRNIGKRQRSTSPGARVAKIANCPRSTGPKNGVSIPTFTGKHLGMRYIRGKTLPTDTSDSEQGNSDTDSDDGRGKGCGNDSGDGSDDEDGDDVTGVCSTAEEVYDMLRGFVRSHGMPLSYIPFHNYKTNLAYLKVGPQASEGHHRDISSLLMSYSDDSPMLDAEGAAFSTLDTFSVNTWSLADDKYSGQTKLYHRRGSAKNEAVSELTLGNNGGHTQWNCQGPYLHNSVPVAVTVKETTECRFRITNRNTLLPNYESTRRDYELCCQVDEISPDQIRKSCKEVYSDYRWVLDPVANRKELRLTADPIMQLARNKLKETGSFARTVASFLPPKRTVYIRRYRFKRLSPDQAKLFEHELVHLRTLMPHINCPLVGDTTMCTGVPRPERIMSVWHFTKAQLARSPCMVRDLLARNKAPRIMCNGIPAKCQSLLITRDGRVAGPNEPLSSHDLVMKVSNRSNPSCNPDANWQFLVTHPYKNEFAKIDVAFQVTEDTDALAVDFVKGRVDDAEFKKRYERTKIRYEQLEVCLGFSGGSQASSGAHAFNVNVSKASDPHYRTLYNQSHFTSENATLTQMEEEGYMLALIANYNKWFSHPRDPAFYIEGSDERAFMLGERNDLDTQQKIWDILKARKATPGVPAQVDTGNTQGDDNLEDDEFEDDEDRQGRCADEQDEFEDEEDRQGQCNDEQDCVNDTQEDDAATQAQSKDPFFLCGGTRPEKHRSSVADDFRLVGYYYVKKILTNTPLTDDEIILKFAPMPEYAQNNYANLSYLKGIHKQLLCKPAIPFEQFFQLAKARVDPENNPIELLDVPANCEADVLSCNQEEVVSWYSRDTEKLARMGVDRYPGSMISKADIYVYLQQFRLEALIEKLTCMEESGELYSIDVDTVPCLCQVNAIAVSLRSQRQFCVRDGDADGIENTTPLMGPVAECLPASVRQKPSPCVNRDADVSTCLLQEHIRRTAALPLYADRLRLVAHSRHSSSYEFPDLACEANKDFLQDLLFAAMLNRLFDPTFLSDYLFFLQKNDLDSDLRHDTLLPLRCEVDNFLSFLMTQKIGLNRQHHVVIPVAFKVPGSQGKIELCRFIRNYASHGTKGVRDYLDLLSSHDGKLGEGTEHWKERRLLFFKVVKKSLRGCSNAITDDLGTDFLVHLMMADIESRFPDLFGEFKISTIHMGYGACVGIRLCTRHMAGRSNRERLEWFHHRLLGILKRLHERDLRMMGYILIGTELYSLFSGRLYSYIDTEHILCKVYVHLTISYPSRTISESPYCHSSFTWPLNASASHWTAFARTAMFDIIIVACTSNFHERQGWREDMLRNYPRQLQPAYKDGCMPLIPPVEVPPDDMLMAFQHEAPTDEELQSILAGLGSDWDDIF